MTNERDLEKEETWNFESAEVREPARSRRAVVSVAMTPADFQMISTCARALGMKISEFIREAAIQRARPAMDRGAVAGLQGGVSGGVGTFNFSVANQTTRSSGEAEQLAVITA